MGMRVWLVDYPMRARGGGLTRARFWRAQGFPNLVLAREAKNRYAERRKEEAAKLKAQNQLRKVMESTGEW
jgi:hypothetical protein